MAHCDEYAELISAAIDGALSPAQQEKLNAHLALCPECRALYKELTALHAALSDLPPVEVPAGLTERIMAAVAAEQVVPFAPAGKKKASVRWQRWLASAAVLAVVLAGTWSWKPWENTVKDLKPASGESAAQQNVTDSGRQPLPEASEAVQAAPEGVLTTADTAAGSDVPTGLAEPASVSDSLPDGGKRIAAKVSEENQDAALPPAANDVSGETPEETAGPAPRMARIGGEEAEETPALRSALSPAAENGDGEVPVQKPALFSAPTLPASLDISQASGETVSSENQEVAVNSTAPALFSAPLPSEGIRPEGITEMEALEELVAYIFEYSGYDSVEYISGEEGLYAQVTAQGSGGNIYLLPEGEEGLYRFEFRPEDSGEVYSFTVCRLTGELTFLSEE